MNDTEIIERRIIQSEYIFDLLLKGEAYVEEKKKYALSIGDWDYYFESFSGLNRFRELEKHQHRLTDAQYWKLLAKYWTRDGYFKQDAELFRRLFLCKRPNHELLMMASEREIFNGLSDEIEIFRGFGEKGILEGWSWTLQEKIAVKFGTQADKGFVVRGTCQKRDVIAYFEEANNRKDCEILIPFERVSLKSWRHAMGNGVEDFFEKAPWNPWTISESSLFPWMRCSSPVEADSEPFVSA